MSSAADVRWDGRGCGGDLLVMKWNDESLLQKKENVAKGQSPTPSPSSPTNPFPFLLCACGFDFLSPVPLSPRIISIQAHTEHCKLISLGYSHRKSGCQILFPPQFLNVLSPPQAHSLALGLSV